MDAKTIAEGRGWTQEPKGRLLLELWRKEVPDDLLIVSQGDSWGRGRLMLTGKSELAPHSYSICYPDTY